MINVSFTGECLEDVLEQMRAFFPSKETPAIMVEDFISTTPGVVLTENSVNEDPAADDEPKTFTKEETRYVMNTLRMNKGTQAVREVFAAFGVENFTELKVEDYAAVIKLANERMDSNE